MRSSPIRARAASCSTAGYLYGAAGVAFTVVLTSLDVADPLPFYGAILARIATRREL